MSLSLFLNLLFISLSSFLTYKSTKLNSYIPFLLSINPLAQILFILYTFYFDYDIIDLFFIHSNLINAETINIIIFVYSFYIFSVYLTCYMFLNILSRSKFTKARVSELGTKFDFDNLVLLYIILSFSILFASNLDGLIAKIIRILHSALVSMPLIIGFFFHKIKKRSKILLFIFIFLYVLVNLSIGSRGSLFIFFSLFTLGFLANSQNSKMRLRFILISFFIFIFLFPLLGFVEIFRTEFGRLGYEDISIDRVSLLINEFSKSNQAGLNKLVGVARMITWPSLSVILLTGDSVASIGLNTIITDFEYIITNTFITGKGVNESRIIFIDNLWGNSPANLYGYSITETNSVEFSLLSDGIWHFGLFGVFIYVSFFCLLVLYIENKLLANLKNIKSTLFKVLAMGFIYSITYLEVSAQPLNSLLRRMLYDFILIFLFSKILCFVLTKNSETIKFKT